MFLSMSLFFCFFVFLFLFFFGSTFIIVCFVLFIGQIEISIHTQTNYTSTTLLVYDVFTHIPPIGYLSDSSFQLTHSTFTTQSAFGLFTHTYHTRSIRLECYLVSFFAVSRFFCWTLFIEFLVAFGLRICVICP